MFKGTWLKNYKSKEQTGYDLNNHEAWRSRKAAKRLYKEGFLIIRRELGLDKDLRVRRPQASHLAKLSPNERGVAAWYFNGKAYRDHPALEYATKQYASKVKRSIEKKLRVDMSVPWRKSHKASALLAKHLVWRGPFKPPAHLADHCFVRATMRERLAVLKDYIATLAECDWQASPQASIRTDLKQETDVANDA